MAVCCFQTHGNLNRNACCFLDGEFAFFGNIFLKGNSLNQLHNNVINTTVISHVKYIDNVRMSKTGCCLGLLLKACGEGCVASILRQHDLDGNRAVEDLVLCTVDGRHAACPHLILEEVSSPEDPLFHSCS